jgi:hypothetical protein
MASEGWAVWDSFYDQRLEKERNNIMKLEGDFAMNKQKRIEREVRAMKRMRMAIQQLGIN